MDENYDSQEEIEEDVELEEASLDDGEDFDEHAPKEEEGPEEEEETPLPEFIFFDKPKQEEFLNHHNINNPVQRALFQVICQVFAAQKTNKFGYKKLLVKIRTLQIKGLTDRSLEYQMEALFDILKKEKVGLLTTEMGEIEYQAARVKKEAVLTEAGSGDFYVALVDEEYTIKDDVVLEGYHTLETLSRRGVNVPFTHTERINVADISDGLIKQLTKKHMIIELEYKKDSYVLLTPRICQKLPRFARNQIQRVVLKNEKFLDDISEGTRSNITKIKDGMKTEAPMFWMTLTNFLISEMRPLKLKHKKVPSSVFLSAFIVQHYERNVKNDQDKADSDMKKRTNDMNDIERIVKEEGVISRPKLLQILKEFRSHYNEKFNDFVKEFFGKRVNMDKETILAPILKVENNFIHQDNVLGEFEKRLHTISRDLKGQMLAQMEGVLKNKGRENFFENLDRFRTVIRSRIDDEFFAHLLEKPVIMYRAIEQRLGEGSFKVLPLYFKSGSTDFLDIEKLLGIDRIELFELAFKTLNPFVMLIMRYITGAYRKYIEAFGGTVKKNRSRGGGKSRSNRRGSANRGGSMSGSVGQDGDGRRGHTRKGHQNVIKQHGQRRKESATDKIRKEKAARKQLDRQVEEWKDAFKNK